ncbi:hypothetical protein EBU99_12790 [bacterium]|nr:hypothetical protein [bacterium]
MDNDFLSQAIAEHSAALSFLAVVEACTLGTKEYLNELIFFAADKPQQRLSDDEETLVCRHLDLVYRYLSIQSLAFLPDDLSKEWLQVKNQRAGDESLQEKIDILALTFIEWAYDVVFFESEPTVRIKYLPESPLAEFI